MIVADVSSIFPRDFLENTGIAQAAGAGAPALCNNQFSIDLQEVGGYLHNGRDNHGDQLSLQAPYVDSAGVRRQAKGARTDKDWFTLGKVICGQEIRLCVGQDGGRLYLNAPFQAAEVGAAISATAGCDKRITTCLGKFSALNQILGSPNPQHRP